VVTKIGTATVVYGGNFSLTGDLVSASLTGTVTRISVVSGANTITMTGLSLSLDVLEAALASDELATVSDLFSVVGSQLSGNDTITYTNNSGVGMTFFGGAGNDTITINGPNADTLNGGDGNDMLIGGLGQDTVNGDAGDDRITMLVTAGNVDTIDAGADTDTLVLSGVVPGDHVVVVDLASTTDQVVSIGGVPDALTQINFENLTASGIGSSVTVTGSDGANIIIGSTGNDTLDGGAGNDTLNGGSGNDTFLFGSGDGQDRVQDSSGSADKILFDGGINPLDLVISRQADDLRLAIHGSSDQITVQNWFTSSANRTETIQAGNGQTLLSTQVDQLIQAMAGFTQQSGLTWDQAIDQQPQEVQTILAANWQ
jgi:Ca2+-binding RTX toxin-like protein